MGLCRKNNDPVRIYRIQSNFRYYIQNKEACENLLVFGMSEIRNRITEGSWYV
jgi:hypothetical protein